MNDTPTSGVGQDVCCSPVHLLSPDIIGSRLWVGKKLTETRRHRKRQGLQCLFLAWLTIAVSQLRNLIRQSHLPSPFQVYQGVQKSAFKYVDDSVPCGIRHVQSPIGMVISGTKCARF